MKNHMQGFSLNTNSLILIVVAVLALAYFGVVSFPGASGGAKTGSGYTGGGVTVLPSTQNLYVNSINTATPQTAVTTNSNVYTSLGGLLKSQLVSGTAQAVPANDNLRVFTNATGYFSSEDTVPTGTQSTITFSPSMAQAVAPTVTILNPNSYTTNALTAKQTFAASTQYTFKVDVSGATNDYIGNPKINQIEFALLLTTPANWAYSSTADSAMSYQGQPCTTVAPPVTGANRQVAWLCPLPNGGFGTTMNEYMLTLKTSSAGGATANSTLSAWGVDKYQNTLNGVTAIGVEDNTGAKLHTETNATIFT